MVVEMPEVLLSAYQRRQASFSASFAKQVRSAGRSAVFFDHVGCPRARHDLLWTGCRPHELDRPASCGWTWLAFKVKKPPEVACSRASLIIVLLDRCGRSIDAVIGGTRAVRSEDWEIDIVLGTRARMHAFIP